MLANTALSHALLAAAMMRDMHVLRPENEAPGLPLVHIAKPREIPKLTEHDIKRLQAAERKRLRKRMKR